MRELVFFVFVGLVGVLAVCAWRATEAVSSTVWELAVLLVASVPFVMAFGWAVAHIVNATAERIAARHAPSPPAPRAPRALSQTVYLALTEDERQRLEHGESLPWPELAERARAELER